jgi:hypothetical protein
VLISSLRFAIAAAAVLDRVGFSKQLFAYKVILLGPISSLRNREASSAGKSKIIFPLG